MIGHILICISTSLVLYLAWKLTRTLDQLDQAEKHIVQIDVEREAAKVRHFLVCYPTWKTTCTVTVTILPTIYTQ